MSEVEVWFTDLREANIARNKEWDAGGKLTKVFRGNELAGEVGEMLDKALNLIVLAGAVGRLCNVLKKLERERLGLRGSRATAEDLDEEFADIQICLDLVAMDAGVDLGQVTRDKFNATSIKLGLSTRLERP